MEKKSGEHSVIAGRSLRDNLELLASGQPAGADGPSPPWDYQDAARTLLNTQQEDELLRKVWTVDAGGRSPSATLVGGLRYLLCTAGKRGDLTLCRGVDGARFPASGLSASSALHFDHNRDLLYALGSDETSLSVWRFTDSGEVPAFDRIRETRCLRSGVSTDWDIYAAVRPGGVFLAEVAKDRALIHFRLDSARLDGKRIAMNSERSQLAFGGSRGEVSVCSARGKHVATWHRGAEDQRTRCLAYSPSGRFLAAGISGAIHVFDTQKGCCVDVLPSPDGDVLYVSFLEDDRLLLTGSADGTLAVWSISARRTLTSVRAFERLTSAAYDRPTGCVVASGTDRKVHVYRVNLFPLLLSLPTWELVGLPGSRLEKKVLIDLGSDSAPVWKQVIPEIAQSVAEEGMTAREELTRYASEAVCEAELYAVERNGVPVVPSFPNDLDARQTEFFERFMAALHSDRPLLLEGQVGYLVHYLRTSHGEDDQGGAAGLLAKAQEARRLEILYPEVSGYARVFRRGLSEGLCALGHCDDAWRLREGWGMRIADWVDLKSKCVDKSVATQDILGFLAGSASGLTDFGLRHLTEVKEVGDEMLAEDLSLHGIDLLSRVFWEMMQNYYANDKPPEDVGFLRKYFLTQERFIEKAERWEWDQDREGRNSPSHLEQYAKARKKCLAGRPQWTQRIIESAVEDQGRSFFFRVENAVRARHGIPAIGEGWVSETEMFNLLREHFSEETVEKHARPRWLGRQHLDVFFPERNIAVEYQGAQHHAAIEYWGGEEGLRMRQRLDEDKQRKCAASGVALVHVFPNFSEEDLLALVQKLLVGEADTKASGDVHVVGEPSPARRE